MRWRKLGVVWRADGQQPWAISHATIPTPLVIDEQTIRVFVSCLDDKGRGRPTYVDVAANDPTRILGGASGPLLELGEPGAFDDNGVVATSVVQVEPDTLYMYYAGFELCTHIRYRIFTGLAISRDAGRTFTRYSRVPILDRTDSERFFRCGSFVVFDEGVFKLWYIAGSEWITINGKSLPVYDLRYQVSKDGIHWEATGQRSMEISGEDEHGFGRPWVVRRGSQDYQLYYSIRRKSLAAYRLGYAESADGVNWVRKDESLGLDVSPGEFDSAAIMYSSVVTVNGRKFCFYNGNDFGAQGFGVAELIK